MLTRTKINKSSRKEKCLLPIIKNMLNSKCLVVAILLFSATYSAAFASPLSSAKFGNSLTGEIPIIYNNHHIYVKQDFLKANRVLVALVKDDRVYMPLRNMFEQMGAIVDRSEDGKTITARKRGLDVSVTLGKSEIYINGETRPLDVPPMMYKGVLLVPVRVISEALGAYVQYEPNRHIVVVRYIPEVSVSHVIVSTPNPVMTSAPESIPNLESSPIPMPTSTEKPNPYSGGFVQGAYFAPKNYDEFSAGKYCPEAYLLSTSYAFKNSPLAVKVDFREYGYVTSDNLTDTVSNHYTRFSTIDGGTAQVPVFLARQNSLDARVEYQIASQRINAGIGYLHTTTNYGYPPLDAIGIGLEKLPILTPGIRLSSSVFYYPNARGVYTVTDQASTNFKTNYAIKYNVVKFDVGLALVLKNSPLYIHGGYAGDHYIKRTNATLSQTHDGPYIGLGVKL